jgi:hypothetical protein
MLTANAANVMLFYLTLLRPCSARGVIVIQLGYVYLVLVCPSAIISSSCMTTAVFAGSVAHADLM